jgi:amidase
VAAGMISLADGSDLGGSIRIPASCCGLVGLKPSMGRVSIGPDYGDIASDMAVDGVLTRTVMDTAVALDVISGYEPGDRHCAPAPPASFSEAARSTPQVTRVRVCLTAPLGIPVDDEPAAATVAAAEALRSLGHDVGDGTPEWDDESFPSAWSTYMTATGQHLIRVVERLHSQPVDPAKLEPANRAWLANAAPVPVIDYLEAAEHLWAYARRILLDWDPNEVLLTPTLTRLPAAVGGIKSQAGVTDDATRFSALVRVWNVTGQPAINLPIAHTATGTPVGVQLVAAHGREDLLLALAGQLEEVAEWRTLAPDSTATWPGT